MTALDLTPAGRAASFATMVRSQTLHELRLTLRNGEQLLLTLLIPVGILLFTAGLKVLPGKDLQSVDYLLPGVIALAVMSTAFTGLAIATGFERRYGALKRLGATPLPRAGLVTAKVASVIAVELLQLAVLCLVGLALGWSPHGSFAWVPLLMVLGTATFAGLGLLMAGTLRAEVTLAAANLVYLLLLFLGGLVFPLTSLAGGVRSAIADLPSAALAHSLRAVLQAGATPSGHDIVVLVVWGIVSIAATARFFRWE